MALHALAARAPHRVCRPFPSASPGDPVSAIAAWASSTRSPQRQRQLQIVWQPRQQGLHGTRVQRSRMPDRQRTVTLAAAAAEAATQQAGSKGSGRGPMASWHQWCARLNAERCFWQDGSWMCAHVPSAPHAVIKARMFRASLAQILLLLVVKQQPTHQVVMRYSMRRRSGSYLHLFQTHANAHLFAAQVLVPRVPPIHLRQA